MIVVIGRPGYRSSEGSSQDAAVGVAAEVSRQAVLAGSRVELVGKIGDDAAGDALVLALGREGIGHAALLRDPAHGTPLAGSSAAVDQTIEPDDALGEELDLVLAAEPSEDPALPAGPVVGLAELDGLLPDDPDRRPGIDAGDVSLALRYLTEYSVIVVADSLDEATARVVAEAATFGQAQVVALVLPGEDPPAPLDSATLFEAPASDPDGAFARVVGSYAAALDGGTAPAEAFARALEAGGWREVEA